MKNKKTIGKPTNKNRAEWAGAAIKTFVLLHGDNEDDTQNAYDLIADLLHRCHQKGISADEVMEKARGHFEYEIKNEGRE